MGPCVVPPSATVRHPLMDATHMTTLTRMNDKADADAGGSTAGMNAVFWAWTTIIVVGLGVMIVIPLTGR